MRKFSHKVICFVLSILLLFTLGGCQNNPNSSSVVSKNDGAFDTRLLQSATTPAFGKTEREIHWNEQFASTDGSVNFTLDVETVIPTIGMPVVEVKPHFLTAADAKHVAAVLMGEVDFFEQEPLLAPNYSKQEIQERLNRWSRFANADALLDLFGDKIDPENTLRIVKGFINDYTELYNSAPDIQRQPCEWKFKKDAYYFDSPEDILSQDIANDNDAIKATAKVGDVEYTFEVSTRNMNDFKINNIFLHLYSGASPDSIDTRIYTAALCRTQKPTNENITNAQIKAQEMLDSMNLGQWKIDNCSVETTYWGDVPEYTISINAVPVVNGISAIHQPQLNNLKSTTAYASNYYLSEVNFQFSANGEIVSFSMYSPVDVKEIINENVATLSVDELMERSKSHLMLSDYYQYGISSDHLDAVRNEAGEELICKINICTMDYGLLRVKVPNTDESYYYVPGIMLSGTIDYVGKKTGTIYEASGETIWNERLVPLVALNAVDGSVIEIYQ